MNAIKIIKYKAKEPGIGAIKKHPYVVKSLGQKDTDKFIDEIFVDEQEQAQADIEKSLLENQSKLFRFVLQISLVNIQKF